MNVWNRAKTAWKTLTASEDGGTTTVSEDMTISQLVDFLHLRGVKGHAMGEATYFACLRALSEGMGKLPLKLQQKSEDLGVVTRHDLPLHHVLNTRPNPYQTATRFWATMEMHKHHHGNAFARIERLPRGGVYLWQLPSESVDIWWDNSKLLSDVETIWYRWWAPNGQYYVFPSSDIIHQRTWCSVDGITGLAVRDILRATMLGATTSQKMLNTLYANGFTSKAVVQYTGDLNGDLAKEFVSSINAFATAPVEQGGGFIPIPIGTKVEPLNISLVDGQFLELRNATALQVAAAFGITPDQINDYSKSSYASSEAQQLAFLVGTQLYALKDTEEELGYKLLTDHQRTVEQIYPKFNTAVVLRADTKTQIETLAKAVAGGLMTPNEGRAMLDRGAMPGGDQLLGNGNLIPLTLAGSQYVADLNGGDDDE